MWEAGIGPCTRVAISAIEHTFRRFICSRRILSRIALLALFTLPCDVLSKAQATPPQQSTTIPPRVAQARRFLKQRGWPTSRHADTHLPRLTPQLNLPATSNSPVAIWQPLGPTAVLTPNFGLVSGRVSSIAIDPADATGNHVFVGTTGGGIWASQNAASSGNVVFSPLTDTSSAFSNAQMTSISIGALTVQPGGTGVVLGGTGDPNDALDSYYGAGILRSADGGNTWTLISQTANQIYSFLGEGFSGFAWSTVNPQLVVAAVSVAYEATLVDAPFANASNAGLYYSTDAGASWSLATITDGPGSDVEGPLDSFDLPNGNSVTSVVWNPVRRLFIAAVRFHGYYQSTDGITWTRMTTQPGAGFTRQFCPSNPQSIGSIACPIFRGSLAVNPVTGDTFAWTVDFYNQDQGLWQDACSISSESCSNQVISFATRWNTSPLESNTILGAATIANGDYNLALAAVPSAQDTLLFAGVNDLWKCNLAMGCIWRNTTNATSCMSAQVAPYQHALAWNPTNPQEILVGNDSGLWRSMDAITESGSTCSSSDATHFENLNSGLGSLAEVANISQIGSSPYTLMAGLGVNGTAGSTSSTGPTSIWPQVLGGEGGPVAIDPVTQTDWYVNSSAGVSIYRCSQSGNCNPAAFGTSPVVDNSDVSGDGYTMTSPAPFIVDPLDHNQVLVGTCRLWRGPGDGTRWTSANAISPILDGFSGLSYCSGDALIRSIAALPVTGGEVIYVGMYGTLNGGSILGGHVFKAMFVQTASSLPSWQDVSLNPVDNDNIPFNRYALDISSIFIDPHDPTGNTVYVTVAGVPDSIRAVRTLYRTTDGGAHWNEIVSNLVGAPANGVVIDPQDANTAYVATDEGVWSTRQVSTCVSGPANCWSLFGAGLPYAPVIQLSASPSTTSPSVLVAGTYGRGIWQIPLLTAGQQLTSATVQPGSLVFASQPVDTTSAPMTVTLTNTGGIALVVSSIHADQAFSEIDNCLNTAVSAGSTCTINVTFSPSQVGSVTGQIVINANVAGGQIAISLSGTASAAGVVTASPGTLNFGQLQIGTTSASLPVTLTNAGGIPVAIAGISTSLPFNLAANACGNLLGANSACALSVNFTPTQAGLATGSLTLTDDAGVQTIALTGIGALAPTDSLSPSSITFSSTVVGQPSAPQFVTLSNNGDLSLNSISARASAGFQASSNCGGSLGPHASCIISVVFAPASSGTQSGTLVVSDAIRNQSVSLSGIGLQPPAISVTPTNLAFPVQAIGTASTPLTVTIGNSGGAPMADVGFQITGQSAGSYSFGASTCGATLPSGGSCTVRVSFTPVTAGQLIATLTISASTLGVAPAQVPLTGIGQSASGITIVPSQMNFTEATLGQSAAAQTATISNTGTVSASGLSVSVSPPFSLTANTCGTSLASGASCTVGVVFTPTVNGVVGSVLTVNASGLTNAASMALIGAGGAAGSARVQPASLTFASTGVGAKSALQTVTVTNNGPVPVSGFTLTTSAGFQVSSVSCGVSLDPGNSCTVQIAFAPSAAGQQTGNLTIASPSLAADSSVSLSGMGFDFVLSPTGQSSQTIPSGQTANYVLSLAPMSGSSGTFTFSCSGLPVNSACSFNPASESIAANATGSVTVQVATGISSSSANLSGSTPRSLHLLPVVCTLFFLTFGLGRRRRWIAMAIVTATFIGLTGCASAGGGGGGTPPPGSGNGNTPAGTYSIVVTAASNGISHKTTLTLTVD